MKNRDVASYEQQLDNLFEKIKDVSDFKLKSHWARYLCVRVSGYLETSVRAIYSEYSEKKANENVANYVSDRLKQFRSPTMGNILTLTRAFSRQWAEELESATAGELKASVDAIVTGRHKIAHGRRDTKDITYVRIRKHYQNAMKVVELIEEQCS